MFGSASAPPSGLRSSRTEHPQHQRPKGWAKTNRRSGPSQVAKLRNKRGERSEAIVETRYRCIKVLPPVAKQKLYPALELTVTHATEPTDPKDRDRIDWRLITDLTVRSREEAIEKLRWYGLRWKIETFHKILKSGCKAEEARLRAAERIVNLLAVLCLLSWRIFWITMLNRAIPEAAPELAFTPQEIYLLDQLVSDTAKTAAMGSALSLYLTKLARLGGYLARAKDPPPGNTVMWRGLTRLTDIQLGFILGVQLVVIERKITRLHLARPEVGQRFSKKC